jgi:protoporphyrin/coproporphyrin ferrochelatase
VVLPLYPQHSGTTTGSAIDAVQDGLSRLRWFPELRPIGSYHVHPRYIAALAESVRDHWALHGRGQQLLMSFHGIPRRYSRAGDPYEQQCHETAQQLASALQLPQDQWQIVFQSRVGRAAWLQPYIEDVLGQLPQRGLRRIDVVAPGFAADCLETLDEIVARHAAAFVAAGGDALRYVPALNARASHIDALAHIVAPHLA